MVVSSDEKHAQDERREVAESERRGELGRQSEPEKAKLADEGAEENGQSSRRKSSVRLVVAAQTL